MNCAPHPSSFPPALLGILLLGTSGHADKAARAAVTPAREVREAQLWDPNGPCCILRRQDCGVAELPTPYRPRRLSQVFGPGLDDKMLAAGLLTGTERAPKLLLGSGGAAFLVVYTDSAGQGFWDPLLGPQRRAAFEFAAARVVAMIEDDDIVISIDATMVALGVAGGNLASGGASAFYQDSDFPFPDSWYGESLYSHLDDADPDTDLLDIGIQFNSSWDSSATPWYYGTDGQPGASQTDFVSVAMHELVHGLDFADSFQPGGGTLDDDPVVFDNFLVDANGAKLIGLPDVPSTVTGNDVFWDGGVAKLCWRNHLDQNGRPPMFAPTPYLMGSSIAHWDESTFSPPWDLMTPNAPPGSASSAPDALTRGLLTDIGWKIEFEAVYVSPLAGDVVTGKPHQPYGSLAAGVNAAAAQGKSELFLADGSHQVQALVIDQPVTLHGWPGTAVVE